MADKAEIFDKISWLENISRSDLMASSFLYMPDSSASKKDFDKEDYKSFLDEIQKNKGSEEGSEESKIVNFNPKYMSGYCSGVPSLNISHSYSNIGNQGIGAVIKEAVSGLANLISSFSRGAGATKFAFGHNDDSGIYSNLIVNDYMSKLKQFEDTTYDISIPEMSVNLLPSCHLDSDGNCIIDKSPIDKLNLYLFRQKDTIDKDKGYTKDSFKFKTVDKDGNITEDFEDLSKSVTDSFNNIKQAVVSAVERHKDENAQDRISNTSKDLFENLKSVGTTAIEEIKENLKKLKDNINPGYAGGARQLGNLYVKFAPNAFNRQYVSDGDNMDRTFLLFTGGFIYHNVLINNIGVQLSPTRIFELKDMEGADSKNSDEIEVLDRGPSWIKLNLSFTTAKDYTYYDLNKLFRSGYYGDKIFS